MIDGEAQNTDSDFISKIEELEKTRDNLQRELKELKLKNRSRSRYKFNSFNWSLCARISGHATIYAALLALIGVLVSIFLWGYGFIAEGLNSLTEHDFYLYTSGRSDLNCISRHGNDVFKEYLTPLVRRVRREINSGYIIKRDTHRFRKRTTSWESENDSTDNVRKRIRDFNRSNDDLQSNLEEMQRDLDRANRQLQYDLEKSNREFQRKMNDLNRQLERDLNQLNLQLKF